VARAAILKGDGSADDYSRPSDALAGSAGVALRALDAFYRFTRPHTMLGTTVSVLSISFLAVQVRCCAGRCCSRRAL
jgi:hypothetical protein